MMDPAGDTPTSKAGWASCNCAYGPQDPRCCIPRAQRRRDEEIWEMGRRGEPLPPVRGSLLEAKGAGWGLNSTPVSPGALSQYAMVDPKDPDDE